jgi:dual specificity tyrosine-phosphorylation-regulated kinase 2/3/4
MIAKLHAVVDEHKDFWLIYEVGSMPLSKLLFDWKGETYKGERIYGVQHQEFYRLLKQNK